MPISPLRLFDTVQGLIQFGGRIAIIDEVIPALGCRLAVGQVLIGD